MPSSQSQQSLPTNFTTTSMLNHSSTSQSTPLINLKWSAAEMEIPQLFIILESSLPTVRCLTPQSWDKIPNLSDLSLVKRRSFHAGITLLPVCKLVKKQLLLAHHLLPMEMSHKVTLFQLTLPFFSTLKSSTARALSEIKKSQKNEQFI